MFKSKFANALTTMMIGSLGIAAAQNKLSVGYGAEAGHMDPLIAKMCARYCQNSFVITRNEESRTVLRELGVPTELGTDTAWTFEPAPPEYGQNVLRKVGWDGTTPVLVVCPINPFEWPVKASVAKFAARSLTGAYKDSHYRSVYFHNSGPAADRALEHYLTSIANAVDAFRKQRKVFVILAATERLDARPAKRISEKLGGVPVLSFRRLQDERTGQRSARLPHDGFVALSRHRDLDARPGALGGHHHGRTHPQPDERARPARIADERGRSRPGAEIAGGAWRSWPPRAKRFPMALGRR